MRSAHTAIKPPAVKNKNTYDRQRDLPRLLPLWPEELADNSLDGRAKLVARLGNLLRRERQRGLVGDWCYDLARHRQLLSAYKAEWQEWRRAIAADQAAGECVPH